MPGSGSGSGSVLPDPVAVERAVIALREGRPVVLPTDTVYGVAVLASVAGATSALFGLKERAATQPFAVLVADLAQARSLAEPLSPLVEHLASTYWPGPLTLVVRRRRELADLELGGNPSTIGVRCPDHPLVRDLAQRLGPIVTTSANRHGEPTPATATGAAAALGGPVAEVLDGGVLDGQASAVIDCTVEPPKLLRGGKLTDALRTTILEHGP